MVLTVLVLGTLMVLSTNVARAQVEGFVSLEYRMAEPGRDTPQDIAQSLGWRPFDGTLTLGYRKEAVWLKVWPQQDAKDLGGDQLLRVGMPFLDDVRFYTRNGQGQWVEQRQGDTVPKQWHERRDRLFMITAPVPSTEPTLIRIESASALAISVQHFSRDTLNNWRLLEHALLGGFIVLWSLLLLWSAGNALLFRDAVSGWFSVYQLSSMLMGLGLSGYSALLLPPDVEWISGLTSVLVLASTQLGILFHRYFAREVGVPKPALRVLDAAQVLGLVNFVLLAVGQSRLALELNAMSIVFCMGLYLPTVMLLLVDPQARERRLVLAAYTALGLFIFITVLPVLGVGNLGYAGLYASVLHSVLTALSLGVLMVFRNARMVREASEARLAAELANRDAQRARVERDEKDRLLSMLAHELRTPLSVLRMVVEAEPAAGASAARIRLLSHGQQAVRDMNEVIERSVQADRVERDELSIKPVPCHPREVLQLVLDEAPDAARLEVRRGEVPNFITDPFWLKTILTNLLDNALKYSPAGSVVLVDLQAQPQEGRAGVRFSVRNQPGVAGRPDPARVFSKYYRSEGAHRSTGSGLGLFLVAGLARRLGGRVRLVDADESSPVEFELWLPT